MGAAIMETWTWFSPGSGRATDSGLGMGARGRDVREDLGGGAKGLNGDGGGAGEADSLGTRGGAGEAKGEHWVADFGLLWMKIYREALSFRIHRRSDPIGRRREFSPGKTDQRSRVQWAAAPW